MKKILSVIVAVAVNFVSIMQFTAFAKESDKPAVNAQACVLYCVDDGKVYFSVNENKKMKPASTTKLMTSLLTLEYADSADKTVTFTKDMTAEGSSMYLKIGEKVRLSDLAAGMMMASGNDAANAAAISISGSTEKFAELMNKRAAVIGMKNTHFVTPSGLDDENHYSTAYDMALLMSYALENESFAKLTSQKSVTVEFVEPEPKKTTYTNHNRLLSMYEYCTGGKTGYTMAAGRCLVSSAQKDGLTFVCVTLNDRNDWNDHIALYNYGFSQFACVECDDSDYYFEIPCAGGDDEYISVTGTKGKNVVVPFDKKSNVERTVYADNYLYAPIKDGDFVGRVDYTLDGRLLASTKLVAVEYSNSQNNSQRKNKSIWTKIKEFFTYGKE